MASKFIAIQRPQSSNMTTEQDIVPGVSGPEYAKIVEQRGWSVRSGDRQQDPRVKLFDVVTQDWSKPLAEGLVYQHFIKKVCYICSACNFVTVFDGGVQQHHKRVLEQASVHKGASMRRIERNEQTMDSCTACEAVFQLRKMAGPKHLERMQADGLAHQVKVESLTVHQYSMVPSEPVVLERRLIADGVEVPLNGHSPVAKGEGIPRRLRRRGRRGRSKHGH